MNAETAAERARKTLDEALARDWSWVRVHAAEILALFGARERVRALFLAELPAAEKTRFRTGLWRVLADTAGAEGERNVWIATMERAFLDPLASDRSAALESLCKLRYQAGPAAARALQQMADESSDYVAIEPLWALALRGNSAALDRLISFLSSLDPSVRFGAAFALRWIRPVNPAAARALVRAIAAETPETAAYPFLLSAGLLLDVDRAQADAWRARLDALPDSISSDARYEVWQALMTQFTPADLPRIAAGLDHSDPNSRVGTAWTILHVLRYPRSGETGSGR